jgi:hypothetical protein
MNDGVVSSVASCVNCGVEVTTNHALVDSAGALTALGTALAAASAYK